jgi:hypothetical protein
MCVAELCLRLQDFDSHALERVGVVGQFPTKLPFAIRSCSHVVQLVCVTRTELAIKCDLT